MSDDFPLPSAVRTAPREEAPLMADFGQYRDRMLGMVPHIRAIGMTLEAVWRGHAVVRVPFDPRFVGNPGTGVIHGGVITTILDNVSGIAVAASASASSMFQTATLDLRIDYMRPATPHEPIYAHAECVRTTRAVAFVKGTAYNLDGDDPIAMSTGAFMIG